MKLQIVKKTDDPIALRISIGGNFKDAYIVYRGDLAKIKLLLIGVNVDAVRLLGDANTIESIML